MKSKIFQISFFASIALIIVCTPSCNKPYQPVGTNQYERPFFEYLWYHSLQKEPSGPRVEKEDGQGPVEIGYSFTSSVAGIVDKLGVMLPDSGNIYTVSLWDGVTKELLLQKNIQIEHPNLFNYVDLLPSNEFKVILPNHPYMIGVFTAHISATPNLEGDAFYHVIINSGNIFPFTGYPHVVNFIQEYTVHADAPTFPTNLWPYGYVVTGLCDLEFTYVKPFDK